MPAIQQALPVSTISSAITQNLAAVKTLPIGRVHQSGADLTTSAGIFKSAPAFTTDTTSFLSTLKMTKPPSQPTAENPNFDANSNIQPKEGTRVRRSAGSRGNWLPEDFQIQNTCTAGQNASHVVIDIRNADFLSPQNGATYDCSWFTCAGTFKHHPVDLSNVFSHTHKAYRDVVKLPPGAKKLDCKLEFHYARGLSTVLKSQKRYKYDGEVNHTGRCPILVLSADDQRGVNGKANALDAKCYKRAPAADQASVDHFEAYHQACDNAGSFGLTFEVKPTSDYITQIEMSCSWELCGGDNAFSGQAISNREHKLLHTFNNPSINGLDEFSTSIPDKATNLICHTRVSYRGYPTPYDYIITTRKGIINADGRCEYATLRGSIGWHGASKDTFDFTCQSAE